MARITKVLFITIIVLLGGCKNSNESRNNEIDIEVVKGILDNNDWKYESKSYDDSGTAYVHIYKNEGDVVFTAYADNHNNGLKSIVYYNNEYDVADCGAIYEKDRENYVISETAINYAEKELSEMGITMDDFIKFCRWIIG